VNAGILSGVAQRAKAPEYARLLGDCRGLYCEARLGLVAPVTRARIAALSVQQLPSLTRAGCAYLMQASAPCLCILEQDSEWQGAVSMWHRVDRRWQLPSGEARVLEACTNAPALS
jgi:hypothetical protein